MDRIIGTRNLLSSLALVGILLPACTPEPALEQAEQQVSSPGDTCDPRFGQLTNGPCGDPFSGGPKPMANWTEEIEERLDAVYTGVQGDNLACTPTGETVTKTMFQCYLPQNHYSGELAGNQACTLLQWAKENVPSSTGGGNLTLYKWFPTDYAYFHDPDTNCPDGCYPSAMALRLEVTYTKYRCLIAAEYSSQQFRRVDFGIIGPPSPGHSLSDGVIQLRLVKEISDGDDEADGGDDSRERETRVQIVDPPTGYELVSGTAWPAPLDSPDDQIFEFEVLDHSLAELLIQVQLLPE